MLLIFGRPIMPSVGDDAAGGIAAISPAACGRRLTLAVRSRAVIGAMLASRQGGRAAFVADFSVNVVSAIARRGIGKPI